MAPIKIDLSYISGEGFSCLLSHNHRYARRDNWTYLDAGTPQCHTRRQTAGHPAALVLPRNRSACTRSSRRPWWTSWCCPASDPGAPSCCPWDQEKLNFERVLQENISTLDGSSLQRGEREPGETHPKKWHLNRKRNKHNVDEYWNVFLGFVQSCVTSSSP